MAWTFLAGCMAIAPRGLHQLAPEAFAEAIADPSATVVDVHVPEQVHLPGTDAWIHYRRVADHLDRLPADRDAPIYLYCRTGHMVNVSARLLMDAGYTNLYNLRWGTWAWERAGLPYDPAASPDLELLE